eukprot:jgi/Mesvir1/19154/Mv01177-RA.1
MRNKAEDRVKARIRRRQRGRRRAQASDDWELPDPMSGEPQDNEYDNPDDEDTWELGDDEACAEADQACADDAAKRRWRQVVEEPLWADFMLESDGEHDRDILRQDGLMSDGEPEEPELLLYEGGDSDENEGGLDEYGDPLDDDRCDAPSAPDDFCEEDNDSGLGAALEDFRDCVGQFDDYPYDDDDSDHSYADIRSGPEIGHVPVGAKCPPDFTMEERDAIAAAMVFSSDEEEDVGDNDASKDSERGPADGRETTVDAAPGGPVPAVAGQVPAGTHGDAAPHAAAAAGVPGDPILGTADPADPTLVGTAREHGRDVEGLLTHVRGVLAACRALLPRLQGVPLGAPPRRDPVEALYAKLCASRARGELGGQDRLRFDGGRDGLAGFGAASLAPAEFAMTLLLWSREHVGGSPPLLVSDECEQLRGLLGGDGDVADVVRRLLAHADAHTLVERTPCCVDARCEAAADESVLDLVDLGAGEGTLAERMAALLRRGRRMAPAWIAASRAPAAGATSMAVPCERAVPRKGRQGLVFCRAVDGEAGRFRVVDALTGGVTVETLRLDDLEQPVLVCMYAVTAAEDPATTRESWPSQAATSPGAAGERAATAERRREEDATAPAAAQVAPCQERTGCGACAMFDRLMASHGHVRLCADRTRTFSWRDNCCHMNAALEFVCELLLLLQTPAVSGLRFLTCCAAGEPHDWGCELGLELLRCVLGHLPGRVAADPDDAYDNMRMLMQHVAAGGPRCGERTCELGVRSDDGPVELPLLVIDCHDEWDVATRLASVCREYAPDVPVACGLCQQKDCVALRHYDELPRVLPFGRLNQLPPGAYRGAGLPETMQLTLSVGPARRQVRVTVRLRAVVEHTGGHFVLLRRRRAGARWEVVDGLAKLDGVSHRDRVDLARLARLTDACCYVLDEQPGETPALDEMDCDDGVGAHTLDGDSESAVVRECWHNFVHLQDACEGLALRQRSDVAFKGPLSAPLELLYALLCRCQAQSSAHDLRCVTFDRAGQVGGAGDVGARFALALLMAVWQRAQGTQQLMDAASGELERALAAFERRGDDGSLLFSLELMLSHVDAPRLVERGPWCVACGQPVGTVVETELPLVDLARTTGGLTHLIAAAVKERVSTGECAACGFACCQSLRRLHGRLPACLVFRAADEAVLSAGRVPPDRFSDWLALSDDHEIEVDLRLCGFVQRTSSDRLSFWQRACDTPDGWWVSDGTGPARRRRDRDLAGGAATEMVYAYEVAAAAGAAYYDEDLGDAADAPLDAPAPREAERAPRSPVVVDGDGQDERASHAAPVRPIDVSRDDDVAIDTESLTRPLAAAPRDDDCVRTGEGQDTTPFAFRPRRAAQQQPLVADCHRFVTFLQQNGGATLPPNPRGSYKWGENSCPTDAALGLLYLALAVTKEGLRLLTCHRADESHGDACALGLLLLFCMHASRTGNVSIMTRAREAVRPRLDASLGRARGAMDSVTSTAAGLLRYVDGVVPRQGDFACRAPFPVDGRLVDVNKFTLSPWEADRMDIDERIAAACTQERMGARPPCHHCGSPRCVPRRYFDRVPPVLVFLNVSSHLPLINYVGSGLPKTLEMTLYIGRACVQVRVALRLCGAVEYHPAHFVVLRPVDLDAGTWEEVDDGPGLCAPVIRIHPRMNLVALATKTTACAYSVTVLDR